MTRSKVLAFRAVLAESGVEMTPKEAKMAYRASRDIVKKSRSMSMADIWRLRSEKVEGISDKEKEQMIELYMRAKEL